MYKTIFSNLIFNVSSIVSYIKCVGRRVEAVLYRLRPDQRDPGSIPAHGHLLQVLPSIPYLPLYLAL